MTPDQISLQDLDDAESIIAQLEEGICPFCGKGPYKLVLGHVSRKHGIVASEIKDHLLVAVTRGFLEPSLSKRASETTKRLIAERKLTPPGGYNKGKTNPPIGEATRKKQSKCTAERVNIYYLADPTTHEVKFVGSTRNTLEKRRSRDLLRAGRDVYNEPLSDWMSGLKEQGFTPLIELIEECPLEEVADQKRFWIKWYGGRDTLINWAFSVEEKPKSNRPKNKKPEPIIKRQNGKAKIIRHGATTYSNYGCRCDVCRKDWAVKHANYLQRKRHALQDGSLLIAKHGSTGYCYGCRCDICCHAKALERKRQRRARKLDEDN